MIEYKVINAVINIDSGRSDAFVLSGPRMQSKQVKLL